MIHVVVLTEDNLAEVSIASGTAPDVVSSYYRANHKEGVPLFYAYSVSQIEQNRLTMDLEWFAENFKKFAKALDLELSTWQQEAVDGILGMEVKSFVPETQGKVYIVHKEHHIHVGLGTEIRPFCSLAKGDNGIATTWDQVTCRKCHDKQATGLTKNHVHSNRGCIRSTCNCKWASSSGNASVCTCK